MDRGREIVILPVGNFKNTRPLISVGIACIFERRFCTQSDLCSFDQSILILKKQQSIHTQSVTVPQMKYFLNRTFKARHAVCPDFVHIDTVT